MICFDLIDKHCQYIEWHVPVFVKANRCVLCSEKAPNVACSLYWHFRYASKDSDCSSDINVWMAVVSDRVLFVFFD